MTKERRLGRGLEALLGPPGRSSADARSPPAARRRPTAMLATPAATACCMSTSTRSNAIRSSRGATSTKPAIDRAGREHQEHGLIQPLVVRRHGDRYQLVAGERRLRAAIKAGWSEVPVQVREADDRQMAEMAIVENLQRKDLNPLEKAASFQQYLERYSCTQEELAGRLKIDRSTIANLIRLLELPDDGAAGGAHRRDQPRARPGPVAAGRRTRAGRVLPADSGRRR